MDERIHTIWSQALVLLNDELTEISFNTWIKTIEPLYLGSDYITLRVPSDFNKGILETRYASLIQNTIRSITKRTYSIRFTMSHDEDYSSSFENNSSERSIRSTLNPKYTFDTFVIGNSNRFAHAASLAVAESPSKTYNPLFLYGGVGLGKTHLMHAIGHCIHTNNPSLRLLYVPSEKFTNDLINGLKDGKTEDFRRKHRNIDVLLIDDIQFIKDKERTQEEFFHTFNTLYEANKQIIISSDRPPKEITTLEDRLRSRFEWGLIADIQPPDYETRIAILRKKAQLESLDVSDDVTAFIANKIPSNIRELEGTLNRVIAYAALTQSEITVDLANEALKDLLYKNKSKTIDCTIILKHVAAYFNIRIEDFKSKKRNREVSFPRQIAMFLCRELTDTSLPKIGELFGGRDHSTVIHACEKISNEITAFTETKKIVDNLRKRILED